MLPEVKANYGKLRNLINGEWVEPDASGWLDVENPATTGVIAQVPLSTPTDVNDAVAAAKQAFLTWRETPPVLRARSLFTLKGLMEQHFEEFARTIVQEHGKTIEDARGETRRAIENVEVAAGIPTLMQGFGLENVASGIDAEAIRQPIGVIGVIGPFNFPLMVPNWFIPYAIATGNTVVVKPSEQTPLSVTRMAELIIEAGIPPGVFNLVHGAKDAVDAMLEHPDVRGISFVGSSPVARYVYAKSVGGGEARPVRRRREELPRRHAGRPP